MKSGTSETSELSFVSEMNDRDPKISKF